MKEDTTGTEEKPAETVEPWRTGAFTMASKELTFFWPTGEEGRYVLPNSIADNIANAHNAHFANPSSSKTVPKTEDGYIPWPKQAGESDNWPTQPPPPLAKEIARTVLEK